MANFKTIRDSAVKWAVFGSFAALFMGGVAFALTYNWSDQAALRGKVSGNQLQSSQWNSLVGNVDNLNERLSGVEASAGTAKWLSIAGTVTSASFVNFNVSQVISNTLLASNPTTSLITIPQAGAYLLISWQYTCTTGANGYSGTKILVNGSQVAVGTSYPNSCDSSSATAFQTLNAWDTVAAQCHNNSGVSTSCSLTVLKL